MLKVAIIVLLAALVASLGAGVFFLLTDQGNKTKRRLFHSLGVRLTLALTLAALLVYGIATGQLGSSTPWDAGPGPSRLPPVSEP